MCGATRKPPHKYCRGDPLERPQTLHTLTRGDPHEACIITRAAPVLEESELQDTNKAAMILGQAAIVVLVSDVASREVSRTDYLRTPSDPYQLNVLQKIKASPPPILLLG